MDGHCEKQFQDTAEKDDRDVQAKRSPRRQLQECANISRGCSFPTNPGTGRLFAIDASRESSSARGKGCASADLHRYSHGGGKHTDARSTTCCAKSARGAHIVVPYPRMRLYNLAEALRCFRSPSQLHLPAESPILRPPLMPIANRDAISA